MGDNIYRGTISGRLKSQRDWCYMNLVMCHFERYENLINDSLLEGDRYAEVKVERCTRGGRGRKREERGGEGRKEERREIGEERERRERRWRTGRAGER